MDFGGGNLKRLIPYWSQWPVWSKDGKKIVFNAIGEPRLANVAGSDKGIFVYDLESEQYHFVTEHVSRVIWSPDEKGIFFEFRSDSQRKGIEITHVVDIDGTNLQRIQLPRPYFLSPNGKYYAYTTGAVFEGSPSSGKRIDFKNLPFIFTQFRSLKRWFPDGYRVLGMDERYNIVIADVRKQAVTIVVEHFPNNN